MLITAEPYVALSSAGQLIILCLLVAATALSIMVILGALVPRWTYNQVAMERDQWRDDAHSCSHAVLVAQNHQQQLLDRVNELQREMSRCENCGRNAPGTSVGS